MNCGNMCNSEHRRVLFLVLPFGKGLLEKGHHFIQLSRLVPGSAPAAVIQLGPQRWQKGELMKCVKVGGAEEPRLGAANWLSRDIPKPIALGLIRPEMKAHSSVHWPGGATAGGNTGPKGGSCGGDAGLIRETHLEVEVIAQR